MLINLFFTVTDTHQAHADVLKGRMIEFPGSAIRFPLVIHRGQHLEARASLQLFPNSATFTPRIGKADRCITPGFPGIRNTAYLSDKLTLWVLIDRYVSGTRCPR